MIEGRWQRGDDWVGAELEDSLVMLQVALGSYVGLNDTAAAVWEAIAIPSSHDDVVAFLRARFDVDEERCGSAVARTLDRFCEVGLAVRA